MEGVAVRGMEVDPGWMRGTGLLVAGDEDPTGEEVGVHLRRTLT